MFLLITYQLNSLITTTFGKDFEATEIGKLSNEELLEVLEGLAIDHFKKHRKLFKGCVDCKVSKVTYIIV